MLELQTNIKFGLFEIANFEQLKQELAVSLQKYKGLVVNEDAITEAKGIRANLNKAKKAFNDRRIELEKKYLEPFNQGKAQVQELIKMIDEVSGAIDTQIKTFEEQEKDAKLSDIKGLWEQYNFNKVKFEQVFNPKWLNKGATLKNIATEMETFITVVEDNLNLISTLTLDKEKSLALQSKYLITLDIAKTIQEHEEEQKIKDTLIVEKKVKESEKPKEEYILRFEVIASEEKIKELSNFLKTNNYKYKQIKGDE